MDVKIHIAGPVIKGIQRCTRCHAVIAHVTGNITTGLKGGWILGHLITSSRHGKSDATETPKRLLGARCCGKRISEVS
jgi:hypothetical protein